MTKFETLILQFKNIKVLDSSIPYSKYIPIDLSVSNKDLAPILKKSSKDFENYIQNYLIKNQAKVAYGGYNEKRNLYQKSSLFNDEQTTERNIHIGIDLWIQAKTPVLAALEGIIYGFDYNVGRGNYGPTIILKHHFDNYIFFTLYGHLSVDSIENLEIGTVFRQGQQLATLGDYFVNGGYAPHLHFQIIKNIEANFSDYPGVCSENDLNYYLENCPDPNLLLKIE